MSEPTADLKSRLLAERAAETKMVAIEVDGEEVEVEIRSLTRGEVFKGQKVYEQKKQDPAELEAFLLSKGMVDPSMTLEEVRQWQKVSKPGEIDEVANAIQELSGMDPGEGKAATERFSD